MSTKKRFMVCAACVVFMFSIIGSYESLAAEKKGMQYPTKPVRILVCLPAGSASDTMMRVIAQALSQNLGQPMVVENKPGGDGAIGATEAMRAAPDGYTLLMGTNSPMAAVPAMRKKPPYDSVANFTPISFFGKYIYCFVVYPGLPVKTISEFINYARANPDKLNYASGNTTGIFAGGEFVSMNGLKMAHVPYKGEPAALLDIISGRAHFMFSSQTTALPFVKDRRLRALAVTNSTRIEEMPEVPTIAEVGVRFSVPPWAGFFGPAGMQPEVVELLNRQVRAVFNRPEIREQFKRYSFDPATSTPEELRKFVKEQIELTRSHMRLIGMEPQ